MNYVVQVIIAILKKMRYSVFYSHLYMDLFIEYSKYKHYEMFEFLEL